MRGESGKDSYSGGTKGTRSEMQCVVHVHAMACLCTCTPRPSTAVLQAIFGSDKGVTGSDPKRSLRWIVVHVEEAGKIRVDMNHGIRCLYEGKKEYPSL